MIHNSARDVEIVKPNLILAVAVQPDTEEDRRSARAKLFAQLLAAYVQ